MSSGSRIVLAGATGNLGHRIAQRLVEQKALVRALTRTGANAEVVGVLRSLGVEVVPVDFTNPGELAKACEGASCVVSALAGLKGVVVDAQRALLSAAVAAGVPRFIPSDFSIDFRKLPPGSNRNLDLRRDFQDLVDKASLKATSIYNGAFADMLTGQAPLVLFKRRRIFFWGDADQAMDFTSIDDTARYTAFAALDPTTPRALCIAGDQVSPRGLAAIMTELTGQPYKLLRPAGLDAFGVLIKVTRALMPTSDALYPPWQGMQYLHNMLSGLATHASLDNGRYPLAPWTTARDVLSAHLRTAATGAAV
jgi:nucleoside-diphosphate-sugar epimerase